MVETRLFEDITTSCSMLFKDNAIKMEESIKSVTELFRDFLGMKSLIKDIEQGR